MNLTEIQNCVSGGPLKEACRLLLRQLGAFSQNLYDRVARVAESRFDEISFGGITRRTKFGSSGRLGAATIAYFLGFTFVRYLEKEA